MRGCISTHPTASAHRLWHGRGPTPDCVGTGQAAQRRWVYLTQETGNPYARPPQYWKAEAAAVEQQGVQARLPVAWPDSFDDQGARMRAHLDRWGGASAANGRYFSTPIKFEDRVQRRRHCSWRGISCSKPTTARPICGAMRHRHRLELDEVAAKCRARRPRSRCSGRELRHRGLGRHEGFEFSVSCFGRAGNPIYDSYVLPLSLSNTGWCSILPTPTVIEATMRKSKAEYATKIIPQSWRCYRSSGRTWERIASGTCSHSQLR